MNLLPVFRKWLISQLGIDKMQQEILALKAENERLNALFQEHDKAVAYMSIVYSKAFRDIMTYFRIISEGKGVKHVPTKKVDDDLIN